MTIHSAGKRTPVNNISEESREYTEIEQVLSLSVCLCQELFDINHVYFCVYKAGRSMKAEARARKFIREENGKDQSSTETAEGSMKPSRWPEAKKKTPKTMLPKARKVRHVIENDMDISLTVGVPGYDIDGATFDRLVMYELHGQQKREDCVPEKLFVTPKVGSQDTAVKQEPTTDPDLDDSEEELDIIKLEDVAPAGTDLQHLLSDLLFAEYNVATKRTREAGKVEDQGTCKPDHEHRTYVVDLEDVVPAGVEMDQLLDDLLFAGYTVVRKGTTITMDQKKEDFLPAYIPLCRSAATRDMQKKK
ncbi:hypothetical protein R1sor_025025 [Riccia sorocarpa]|uniref:Uncharacterized protein n=1 Tax=Riccia sorocarpa TaxID=122646 RepID=A0ABD3G7D4_9MARC